MSEISEKQVRHIAALANINLSKAETKLFTKQLRDIIGYVDNLKKVNTSKVKPTFQTLDNQVNVTRKDKVRKSFTRQQALSAAAHTHQGYFVVDHVFGDQKQLATKFKPKPHKQIDPYNAVLTKVNPKGNIGHKDMFLTKGIETTAGSNVLSGYIAQYSSTIVNKLEKNGYRTKYKFNQDAWAHGSSGENSDFGPTKNPWDKTKVPGGSSSGSAAAVAAGFVDLATGTDTGGSIRLPASFTSTTSIKPTYGALSRYGVIAFASSLDCPSLISTSVKKIKQVFNQIAGFDELDATNSQAKLVNKTPTTIGLPKEFFDSGVNPEVLSLVKQAAETLKKQGLKLKPVSLPHAKYTVAAYYLIASTETASNLNRYDGIRYGQPRTAFGAEAKRRIMLGTFASSAGYADKYYEQAAKIRTLIINDFSKALKSADLLLAPVSPTPPFKLGEKADNPLELYLADVMTIPISLAGLPSLALPTGFTKTNLPVGMQLIGPRWSEPMLFKLGEKYQQLTNWHTKKP